MSSLPTLNICDLTSVNLGRGANAAGANGIAIGAAQGTSSGTVVKKAASADGAESIAIGVGARATGARAVQIGEGTNAAADTIQFQGTHLVTDTAYNALRAYMGTGLKASGDLEISATTDEFKTTAVAIYSIGGPFYSKAATDNLTFTANHVVSASMFGVILVQIDAAGTVSTKVPVATQEYTSAALALAALPAADALNVALGYIAIAAGVGGFTGNTTALTTIATFVDGTPDALPAAI